jgi:hypothetical protein
MNKEKLTLIGLVAALAAMLAACATLNPKADPFVVRVEQTQTTAYATFDMVLRLDQADRGFWRTNAPGFHNFCEWLRTPQDYQLGKMHVPRCVLIQLNVDDLKRVYKASRTDTTSNALWSAWLTLNTALNQSTSWSNIITAPIHP